MQITFDPTNPTEAAAVRRMLAAEQWVVGQSRGEKWDFQGLFPTFGEALRACRSPDYFLGPAVVGEALPDEPVPWPGCVYPLSADTSRAPVLNPEPPAVASVETPPPPPLAPQELPVPPADAEPEQAATPPDRDAAGLPWDARIHSGTRALIADGTWRKRRGVEPEVVEQVEAELRTLVAIPPPADPAEVFKPADAPPPPPAPPAAVAPPPPPAAAAAGDPATFAELMVWLSPRLADKSVTHEQVREAVVDAGLASVENLLARPDLVGAVYRRLAQ